MSGLSAARAGLHGGTPWMEASGLPRVTPEPGDASPVAETLAGLRGARVFFEPLAGNNGDDLIRLGSERELAVHGIELVEDPAAADTIVINGGGGMNDIWRIGFDRLAMHAKLTKTPIVGLPSSYMFETSRLSDLLGERTAPTTLFCRERISLPGLRAQAAACRCAVMIGLDHDMALRLAGCPFVTRAAAAGAKAHMLIVDRTDVENQTGSRSGAHGKMVAPAPKKLIPKSLKQWPKRVINRRLQHRVTMSGRFAGEAKAAFGSWMPEVARLRPFGADLSARDVASFDEWVSITARSGGVASTRLHGAILPVLLGIPTIIRAGAVPKFRGVFELSLRHITHARMLDENGRLVSAGGPGSSHAA